MKRSDPYTTLRWVSLAVFLIGVGLLTPSLYAKIPIWIVGSLVVVGSFCYILGIGASEFLRRLGAGLTFVGGVMILSRLAAPSIAQYQRDQFRLPGEERSGGPWMYLTAGLLILGILGFVVIGVLDYIRQVKSEQRNTDATPFVKIFVWVHLVLIFIKCLPSAPAETKGSDEKPAARKPIGTEYVLLANDTYLKPYVDLYLWPTGFWQSWDMFSPNPSNYEGYVTAKVIYKNGQVKNYTFPRMFELGLGEKYLKERYRKFLERATNYNWMFPTFAQRVALENYTDPKNPPEKVQLWKHYFYVPDAPSFGEYASSLWSSITSGRFSFSKLAPPMPVMPKYEDYRYFPDANVFGDPDSAYPIDQRKLKEMASR